MGFIDFLLIVAGYLCGSIPFGLLIVRWVKGLDIRTQGSGNIGATNVGRIMGAKWFFLVMLLDALKGLVPTAISILLASGSFEFETHTHTPVFSGLAAVLGHMYPCWLKFKGGKGVATALGVVLVLAPVASLIAASCFAVTFAIWRTVSISSLSAAVLFAAVELPMLKHPFNSENWPLGCFSLLVPLLIIYRHRSNILRLVKGEEYAFRNNNEARERDPEN